MEPPERFRQTTPHPEALARFMIEYGETNAALEVCEIWRRHDPSNPRIAQVENEAELSGSFREGPAPLEVTDAERYLQQGYIREALFIYRRLSARSWRKTDVEIHKRANLLEEFASFEIPEDAPPKMVEAEGYLDQRRLPMALLGYHELAESNPKDQTIQRRRDQLRSLIMDMPAQARLEDVAALGDTVNDAVSRAPAERAALQRLPIELEDAEVSRRRLKARTEVDVSLGEQMERIREGAPTERELRIPPEYLEPDAVFPVDEASDEADPGADLDNLGGQPSKITSESSRRAARRASARTVQSASPLVLPQDEEGRSVVEVPAIMPSVMEKIPGRLSAHEAAAEIAESLGVLVRQIYIIEEKIP